MAGSTIPPTHIRSRTTRLSVVKRNPWLSPWAMLVVLAAITWINTTFAMKDWARAWLLTVALVALAVAIVGGSVNGRVEGVFIDNRNRMSLSKFQMVVWTILVLSILVSAAAFNIQWGDHLKAAAQWQTLGGKPPVSDAPWGPLDIVIPPELLSAMGIAAVSFVATPSLLNIKSNDDPAASALAKTTRGLGLTAADTTNDGKVFANTRPGLASWADMFRGDEVGNADAPDLSKIQQFLITLLVVGVYGAASWSMFAGLAADPSHVVVRLPPLSWGLVTLMGISHASYLAYKAAPHTKSAPDQDESDDAAAADLPPQSVAAAEVVSTTPPLPVQIISSPDPAPVAAVPDSAAPDPDSSTSPTGP